MPTLSNTEPHRLSAIHIAGAIDAGSLTAEAVVASCLDRIAAREGTVRAWAHLDRMQALEAARASDKGGKGFLKGVPFGIKDIFDTAEMPAGYGSPIYTGCRPSWDASAADLPRKEGAVLLGKTVTTEFANRHPGPTSNPHNPAYSPGGSSSGSAAAVADFMVPLAIGTQTGGSVIRPAAYCGVVGFKPSFGLFPPAGMHMNTDSLDTVGIMARSVADVALFRAAMMADPYSPPTMPGRAPRLALCRTRLWDRAQPEGRATLEAVAKQLAKAGAEIVDSELPPVCAAVSEVQRRHSAFEAPRNHAPELYRHQALLSHDLLGDGRIEAGRRLSLAEFRAAWRDADRMRAAAREWAAGFDAILTLPAPGEAPNTLARTGDAGFNALWTVLHMPCLTLPAETGPNGLPVGIQLVGQRYRDARLLDTGLWAERALGGRA
ncbi:MAG TPA: amidase [Stellaceae bacterium]|jgi:Asp-tRNA(Asn)/Glu-tRNA(Gln) amidotransferase A subunit family amidase